MESARFITFEGGDGTGKTTQIRLAETYLRQRGFDVCCTRQPGATPLGKEIRQLLLAGTYSPTAEAELFLFLADRAQHVHEIINPALQGGKWVLCDRYSDSTLAYQLAARHLASHVALEPMLRVAELGIQPQQTLWFDLPPEQALLRIEQRGGSFNRLDAESIQFHQRVYSAFSTMHQDDHSGRIQRIDASLDIDHVQQQVQQKIALLLP